MRKLQGSKGGNKAVPIGTGRMGRQVRSSRPGHARGDPPSPSGANRASLVSAFRVLGALYLHKADESASRTHNTIQSVGHSWMESQ